MTRLFPSMRVTVPFWAFGVTIGIFWLAYFTLRIYVPFWDIGPTYRITLWAAAFYGWLACGLNKRASVFELVLPVSTRDLFKMRVLLLFAGAWLAATPAIAEGFDQAFHLGLLMTAAGATVLAWRPCRRVVSYRVFSFVMAVGLILDLHGLSPAAGLVIPVLWSAAALLYAWRNVPATYEISAPQRRRVNWTGTLLPSVFPMFRVLFPPTFWLMLFAELAECMDFPGMMAAFTVSLTALAVKVNHPFLDSLPVSRRQRVFFRMAMVFFLAALNAALLFPIAKFMHVPLSAQMLRYLTIVAAALMGVFAAKCIRWRRLRWLREPFHFFVPAGYFGLLFCLGVEPLWRQVAHKGGAIAIIFNHLNPWMFPPILIALVLLLDWQGKDTEGTLSTTDGFALMRQQQEA